MQAAESEKQNCRKGRPQTLSNVQMELLKLYSVDLQHDDLLELKTVLANHFAGKAIVQADMLWEQKQLSEADMDKWLNEH